MYQSLHTRAQEQIEAFNLRHDYLLSLAVGTVELLDNKILEAVQEADKRMYANKAARKMLRNDLSETQASETELSTP